MSDTGTDATSLKTREPLLTRGFITAGFTMLVAILGTFGIRLDPDTRDNLLKLLLLLSPAVPVVMALITRKHVTSKYAPKNDAGEPLVPLSSLPVAVVAVAGDAGATVGDAVNIATDAVGGVAGTVAGVVSDVGNVADDLGTTVKDILPHRKPKN